MARTCQTRKLPAGALWTVESERIASGSCATRGFLQAAASQNSAQRSPQFIPTPHTARSTTTTTEFGRGGLGRPIWERRGRRTSFLPSFYSLAGLGRTSPTKLGQGCPSRGRPPPHRRWRGNWRRSAIHPKAKSPISKKEKIWTRK